MESFIYYYEYLFIINTGGKLKCQIKMEQDQKEKDLEQEDRWEIAKKQNLLEED